MLAYEAVAAVQEETEWEPYQWTYTADLAQADRIFHTKVMNLVEAAEANRLVFAWSSGTNFRKALYEPYKAGRGRKPLGYWAFRKDIEADTIFGGYPCSSWERPGLEGDDVIGVLMTRRANDMGRRVLWSGDKDLKQIAGLRLVTPKGLPPAIEEVKQSEADWFHAMQTLTGDVTDGYPGCPGYGPVKAAKLIGPGVPGNDRAGTWGAIQQAYEKAGLTRDDMILQARLARILRAEDYDFTKKEPILWSPPC